MLWSSEKTCGRTTQTTVIGERYCINRKKEVIQKKY